MEWAVVTGCTDGIGKGYAFELAKEGLNIVLISRSLDKLNNVSKEIVNSYGVETEIVQINFAEGRNLYPKIAERLEGKDIGILVNNVGVMLSQPKSFEDVSDDDIWSHINVNMGSVVALTKLVLPTMLAQGRGAIINIASIAGSGPIPLLGIYAASKTFVDFFSTALQYEYKDKGIFVQTVNPSYVATNMTSFSDYVGRPNFLVPTAPVFAYHAVATIGHTNRTNGFWVHGIQSWGLELFMPRWLYISLMHISQKFFLKNLSKSHSH